MFFVAGEGVNLAAPVPLSGLLTINHLGDLFDIKPAVLHAHREDFSKVSGKEGTAASSGSAE